MDGNEIRQRFEAQWSSRKTVEQQWDMVSRLVLPFRGDMYREYLDEHAVEWNQVNREIYDSTAVDACQTLAASIHGSLTTPLTRWFELAFRDPELNKLGEAQEWLEASADKCWAALQDSNFNLEVAECYLDLCGYGTSVLVEEAEADPTETWEGLDFAAIPMRECYFEQDHKRRVRRFYRRLEWTALQMVSKFDPMREGGKMPESVYAELDEPEAVDQRHDVIFAIYDRPDKQKVDTSGLLRATERPFAKKYVMREDGYELGEEGGYYEMPAFVTRWRKVAGSQWGYSPAIAEMGDIRTLNELVQMKMDAIERSIDPATLVTERGLLSDFDLSAGALTVLRSLDDMKAYESSARVDWASMEESRIIQQIRKAFFVDQLELKESPAMTATEVTVRYELMQRLLGPTLGRLQNDLLDPTVTRTFYILYRAGQLGEMPEEVKNASNGELDIEYIGPMARAQKADRVAAMERWVQHLIVQATSHPALEEVLDLVDTDVEGRKMAEFLGVPADAVRSETAVKDRRDKREAAQEQAAKLAAAQQAGDAGKAMGEAGQALNAAGAQGGAQELPGAPAEMANAA